MADNPGKASGAIKIGDEITEASHGSLVLGKDSDGNASAISAAGADQDQLKVYEL